MENKHFIDLLNEYKAQERTSEREHLYIAFDDNNSSGDCCQTWSNCCGSGNVGSDCCFDACCSYLCCGC